MVRRVRKNAQNIFWSYWQGLVRDVQFFYRGNHRGKDAFDGLGSTRAHRYQ